MAPVEGGGSGGDGGSSSNSSSSGESSGSAATVSGARGSGGRKQMPSDGALLRVRAALAVSSQGAALLNGSDADGGSLNSGTGCINTRRERETEEEAEGGRASLERRVGAARMVVC